MYCFYERFWLHWNLNYVIDPSKRAICTFRRINYVILNYFRKRKRRHICTIFGNFILKVFKKSGLLINIYCKKKLTATLDLENAIEPHFFGQNCMNWILRINSGRNASLCLQKVKFLHICKRMRTGWYNLPGKERKIESHFDGHRFRLRFWSTFSEKSL